MEVDHVSKSNVEADLECTICMDPSVSPIHSCTNGHIVCGICCDKVKNCGICGEVGLIKNGLAERLAQKYVMKAPCKNFQSGCKIPIKSTEMKAHFPLCEYRPIRCLQTETNDCENADFKMIEFVNHLQDHHKIDFEGSSIEDEYKLFPSLENRQGVTPCEVTILDKKGIYFLMRSVLNGPDDCLWVTVLGGQSEADKFYYTTKLTFPSKNIELTWKFPVLPFHKFDTFDKVVESGQYVRMDYKIISVVKENPLNEKEKPGIVRFKLKILTKTVGPK